ncbi:MAG: polysaccharide deacetylase family protein [Candidatus Helarchaeota archaeon]
MKYRFEWPENKKFAVCLTHDVDRVRKTYQYFTKKDISNLKDVMNLIKNKNPYWNFRKIMEIEDKFGVRSTFFFLQESKRLNLLKPKEWVLSWGKYKFNENQTHEIIRHLDRNGWEIGLHGSYDSYKKIELLKIEKELLENSIGHQIIGVRQHYLNLNIPKTWIIQKAAGFKYDSSFGFRNNIGYRDNKLFPFSPFNDSFNDSFVVIPLTIMDSYLFELSKNSKEAWTKIEELITFAEKHGALLTILWHQRVFNKSEFPDYINMYERIIEKCKKREAFFGTCTDIYEWWINNEQN